MYNKGRRPWKRGAKKRYSVYKHEDRIDGEKDYKEFAERICNAKGYDLEKYLAHDVNPKSFWRVTYARLEDEWKRDPRNVDFGYKPEELAERAEVLELIEKLSSGTRAEDTMTEPASNVMVREFAANQSHPYECPYCDSRWSAAEFLEEHICCDHECDDS